MTSTIMVTAATGKVWRRLIPLLNRRGVTVRAASRTPEALSHMFRAWGPVAWLLCVCVTTACCGGRVTAPGDLNRSYTGEWSGATSQGATITFTVSPLNVVTSITVGHHFNGCRETRTFSGLSLDVGGGSALPGRAPTSARPGFGFGSGSPEAPNFVQVTGQFTSSQAASGTVTFLNFAPCGHAIALWNATKR